jgi:hypothetical protein
VAHEGLGEGRHPTAQHGSQVRLIARYVGEALGAGGWVRRWYLEGLILDSPRAHACCIDVLCGIHVPINKMAGQEKAAREQLGGLQNAGFESSSSRSRRAHGCWVNPGHNRARNGAPNRHSTACNPIWRTCRTMSRDRFIISPHVLRAPSHRS